MLFAWVFASVNGDRDGDRWGREAIQPRCQRGPFLRCGAFVPDSCCRSAGVRFPIPTTDTVFEVVADGKILHVSGARLKKWIENRRSEWKGRRGYLFSQRPMIGIDW